MKWHSKNVCIVDVKNSLSLPPPQQLSVLSRQWPSAWCHGPQTVPADPRAQEDPTWPEKTPFPLLTSIEAIIWEKRASLFCTNRFGLSHILVGGQTDSSMKLREAERRDIMSPTCLFPNIALFSCPTHPLVFVMVPISINKDVNVRGVLSASFSRPRHLFGFLRSDVLMLSANVGG